MPRLLNHVRQNLIGYLALFIALGGTGYAATNSTHQARARIDAAPRSSTKPGGYILAWAHIAAGGQVQGGSAGVKLRGSAGGAYQVTWRRLRIPGSCGVVVSPGYKGSAGMPRTATAVIERPVPVHGLSSLVGVQTFNAQSKGAPAPFTVEIIC